MSHSRDRAIYESRMAAAHRAIFYATEAAERMGDEGAAEDCRQLLAEVTRLASASLSGKLRAVKPLDGQTSIPLPASS